MEVLPTHTHAESSLYASSARQYLAAYVCMDVCTYARMYSQYIYELYQCARVLICVCAKSKQI